MTTCPHCGHAPDAPTHTIGSLSVMRDGMVAWRGTPIPLPNAQRLILEALVSADNLFVSTRSIFRHIGSAADDPLRPYGVVKVQVSKLRRALRTAGVPDCIFSEYGRGYRLDAAALTSFAPPRAEAAADRIPPAIGGGSSFVAASHHEGVN